jgi:glucose-1-phosphate cytidylyltransferase
MQTVLLAGGLGTRLREETEFRPKPMVEIGNKPILWHIMKLFESHNFSNFVICAGYKSDYIRNYFTNPAYLASSLKIRYGKNSGIEFLDNEISEWNLVIAETGYETMTGGRINRAKSFIGNSRFFCTYGDGLANVDITKLLKYHESHGKIATVTAVHPTSRFGQLNLMENGMVKEFTEKPLTEEWINGGYFVFEPGIFDYLDDDSVLEKDVLPKLAEEKELMSFKHEGFWQPMDTYREATLLNEMWNSGKAPWKVWN